MKIYQSNVTLNRETLLITIDHALRNMEMNYEDINLKEMYDYVLNTYAHPIARHIWKLEGSKWNKELVSEDFIARYKDSEQHSLDIHHDFADYTFTVGLNKEFEGSCSNKL